MSIGRGVCLHPGVFLSIDKFIAILWISTARKEFSAPPPPRYRKVALTDNAGWHCQREMSHPFVSIYLPQRSLGNIPQRQRFWKVCAVSRICSSLSEVRQRMGVEGCRGKCFCESFWFRLLSRSMLGCGEDEWFWNITILIYGIMSGGEYGFKRWFMISSKFWPYTLRQCIWDEADDPTTYIRLCLK